VFVRNKYHHEQGKHRNNFNQIPQPAGFDILSVSDKKVEQNANSHSRNGAKGADIKSTEYYFCMLVEAPHRLINEVSETDYDSDQKWRQK
jgi:hypothetical protein